MSDRSLVKIEDAIRRQAFRCAAIEKVILFGSRARGDAQERSDFDLAVSAPTISPAEWARFATEMEENLPTLCHVDLVLLSAETPEPLREQIRRDGKLIYEQAA
jgi:uncharacterized protein